VLYVSKAVNTVSGPILDDINKGILIGPSIYLHIELKLYSTRSISVIMDCTGMVLSERIC